MDIPVRAYECYSNYYVHNYFYITKQGIFFPLNRISHSYGWLGTLCSFNSDSLGSICLVFGLSL